MRLVYEIPIQSQSGWVHRQFGRGTVLFHSEREQSFLTDCYRSSGLQKDSVCDPWRYPWVAKNAFRARKCPNSIPKSFGYYPIELQVESLFIYFDEGVIIFQYCWRASFQSGWHFANRGWRSSLIKFRKMQIFFEKYLVSESHHPTRPTGNRRSPHGLYHECRTSNDCYDTTVLFRSCKRL